MLSPSPAGVRLVNTVFLLCVLLYLLSMAAEQAVSVRVNPSVVLAGNATNLTCHVARNARNRLLRFGILNSERELSERQLDGDSAPITWGPIMFLRLPCGAGPAYCKVVRTDGSVELATATLVVAGCEP